MIVSVMIAKTMFPNSSSSRTRPMNRVWKIGVNSHASRSIGFAPGWAGWSGAWL